MTGVMSKSFQTHRRRHLWDGRRRDDIDSDLFRPFSRAFFARLLFRYPTPFDPRSMPGVFSYDPIELTHHSRDPDQQADNTVPVSTRELRRPDTPGELPTGNDLRLTQVQPSPGQFPQTTSQRLDQAPFRKFSLRLHDNILPKNSSARASRSPRCRTESPDAPPTDAPSSPIRHD